MMSSAKNNFLDFVQQHERTWGKESYPARPTLEEFLQSPVVVFWEAIDAKKNVKELSRYTASLHKNLDEVQDHFLKVLFRSHIDPPKNRLVRVFSNQKPVRIKSVKITFDTEPEK
jgi:hypothetical protein